MKYVLEGNPKEVAKVIQENRIRVERGQISFVLVPDEEEATDSKDVALVPDEEEATDSKDVALATDEENNEVTDSKDVALATDEENNEVTDSKDVLLGDTKATKRSKKSE